MSFNDAEHTTHVAASLAAALIDAGVPLDETERSFCEVSLWNASDHSRLAITHRKPHFVFPEREDAYKPDEFLKLYPHIQES